MGTFNQLLDRVDKICTREPVWNHFSLMTIKYVLFFFPAFPWKNAHWISKISWYEGLD